MDAMEIEVVENRMTGLLLAIGVDGTITRGFMVTGRTDGEVREQIPAALVELLDAMGIRPQGTLKVRDRIPLPDGWLSRSLVVEDVPGLVECIPPA